MMYNSVVDIAAALCDQYHQGQFRRDGVTPYSTHPRRVARSIIARYAHQDQTVELYLAQCAAYLHDVVEDCGVTTDTIYTDICAAYEEGLWWKREYKSVDAIDDERVQMQQFVKLVIDILKLLTKPNGCDYMDYIRSIKTNKSATIVKTFDIFDNLSDAPTQKQITKYTKALQELLSEY